MNISPFFCQNLTKVPLHNLLKYRAIIINMSLPFSFLSTFIKVIVWLELIVIWSMAIIIYECVYVTMKDMYKSQLFCNNQFMILTNSSKSIVPEPSASTWGFFRCKRGFFQVNQVIFQVNQVIFKVNQVTFQVNQVFFCDAGEMGKLGATGQSDNWILWIRIR